MEWCCKKNHSILIALILKTKEEPDKEAKTIPANKPTEIRDTVEPNEDQECHPPNTWL